MSGKPLVEGLCRCVVVYYTEHDCKSEEHRPKTVFVQGTKRQPELALTGAPIGAFNLYLPVQRADWGPYNRSLESKN